MSSHRNPRTDLVPADMKRCTRCEVDYQATVEHFDRNNGKADGLDGWCKVCVGQRTKRYRQMTGAAATHRPSQPTIGWPWTAAVGSVRDDAAALASAQ